MHCMRCNNNFEFYGDDNIDFSNTGPYQTTQDDIEVRSCMDEHI